MEGMMQIWVDHRSPSQGGTHVYFRPANEEEARALEVMFDFKWRDGMKPLPADRDRPVSQGGEAAGYFGGHENEYWIRFV